MYQLDFKGRVTETSIKNFQYVPTGKMNFPPFLSFPIVWIMLPDEYSSNTFPTTRMYRLVSKDDPEKVVLQFGKIGKHEFALDVHYPFSLVQVRLHDSAFNSTFLTL